MTTKKCNAEYPSRCRYHGLPAQRVKLEAVVAKAAENANFEAYYSGRKELEAFAQKEATATELESMIDAAKQKKQMDSYVSLRNKLNSLVGVEYTDNAEAENEQTDSVNEEPRLVSNAIPLSSSPEANDPENRPQRVIVQDSHGESQIYTAAEDFNDLPYSMRLSANRELTDEETRTIAGLTGYLYRSTINGENLGEPERDSSSSFIVSSDFTKGSGLDYMHNFESKLNSFITNGTPIRKTERSGPGTMGTRLIDGIGEDLKIKLYYN